MWTRVISRLNQRLSHRYMKQTLFLFKSRTNQTTILLELAAFLLASINVIPMTSLITVSRLWSTRRSLDRFRSSNIWKSTELKWTKHCGFKKAEIIHLLEERHIEPTIRVIKNWSIYWKKKKITKIYFQLADNCNKCINSNWMIRNQISLLKSLNI